MGWSLFARRYWGNLNWFLFLRVLRCFTSPRSLCNTMYSCCNSYLTVSGFPHSDISGSQDCCRLPEAFRRLTRLSSPLTAKASTMCTSLLDYTTPNGRHKPQLLIYGFNLKACWLNNSTASMVIWPKRLIQFFRWHILCTMNVSQLTTTQFFQSIKEFDLLQSSTPSSGRR